jgi:hypothetical protein
MQRRTLAIVVAVVGIGIAAWLLWPRHPLTDEEKIRLTIEAMAHGAEEKNVAAILDHVSDRYRGEAGSKEDLRGMLFGYLRSSDFVSAVIRGLSVEAQGDAADVTFRVILARVRTPEVKESDVINAGAHEIRAQLVKEDGEWRVSKATQKEIPVGEALLP